MTSPNSVGPEHTQWSSVCTSGWVDVNWAARDGAPTRLPPGLRMSLKHIDKQDMAWVYRGDMGVMKLPAWCLEAWDR